MNAEGGRSDGPAAPITLCVLYRNSQKILGQCLEGIGRLEIQPSELLVIDDGSTDGTAEAAKSYRQVRVITHGRQKGMAASQNAGLLEAANELVAFLDVNYIPDAAWMAWLVNCMTDLTVAISSGSVREREWHTSSLWAVNFLCRRSAVVSVGCFDTILGDGAEYEDLNVRLVDAGYSVVQCREAMVTPQAPLTFRSALRRRARARLPQLGLGSPMLVLGRICLAALGARRSPVLRQISWFLYAYPAPGRPAICQLPSDSRRVQTLRARKPTLMGRTRMTEALFVTYVAAKVFELRLVYLLLKAFDIIRRRRFVRQRSRLGLVDRNRSVPGLLRRVSISACIMTMNQEATLPLPLSSVAGWVDELLVIDGGSTDRSVELAKDYGARVLHNPWPGKNYLQRNIYLGQARGDWLLVLDSDEFLDASAPERIQRLVRLDGFSHFWFLRKWLALDGKTLVYPKDCGIYPDYQMRLFRNRQRAYYTGQIHERLHGYGWWWNWVPDVILYHADLLINSRREREKKIDRYETAARGSGYREYYLFEDFDYIVQPVALGSLPKSFADWLATRYPRNPNGLVPSVR
jgi:glycosyltransferase involved in cell wall biosynthesis